MLREAAVVAALVLLGAALVAPLFTGEFTRHRVSIESAFISDARFIVQHFPDLSWNPLWYLGFPFEWFYFPLLPALVAALGKLIGDVAPAYRIVAASAYALGPVAVYAVTRQLAPLRAAVVAAVTFALLPSVVYVLTAVRGDAAQFTGSFLPPPWRLVALVKYGEGPHVLSLTLALFAVAASMAAIRRPTLARRAIAVVLVVSVALTNLIGLFGLAVFLFGVAVAFDAGVSAKQRWARLLEIGAIAGVISLAWYSLGFIRAVLGFRASGEPEQPLIMLVPLLLVAAAVLARVIGRAGGAAVPIVWLAIFAPIALLHFAFEIPLLPQAKRYALELDAALAIAVGAGVVPLVERLLSREIGVRMAQRAAVLGALAVAAALGAPGGIAAWDELAPERNWRDWSERRVALWLAEHLGPGERAYATGSHALWMNVFADVPQVRGGVDFAYTNEWWAHVSFQTNVGTDADISVLWMQALPVRYVVVTGRTSPDVYRDWLDPAKFDGRLPVVFEERGVKIYEVPRTGHPVMTATALNDLRSPVSAIDRDPLASYVRDVRAGRDPVSVDRSGLAKWRADVDVPRGGSVIFRQAYDSGWRAFVDGRPATVTADPIGQTAVEVSEGRHTIELDHRVHRDLIVGQIFALLVGLALTARALRAQLLARRAPTNAAPSVAPPTVARARPLAGIAGDLAALRTAGFTDVLAHPVLVTAGAAAVVVSVTLLYAVVLGVITGFPKGSDAYQHLTRLAFVAAHFPAHDWLYVWGAGMPAFDNYPALPYVASVPLVGLIGAEMTLRILALVAHLALPLGVFGHLIERKRSPLTAMLASLLIVTSLAVWDWTVFGGVYARVIAAGAGAIGWWSHARALRTRSALAFATTAVLLAIAIACHPVIGGVAAVYVAGVHIGTERRAGVRSLSLLAGTAALLVAPTIVSTVEAGLLQRFVGIAREARMSAPEVLFTPAAVGLAAFSLALAVVIARLTDRTAAAITAAGALGATLLYLFAPNLGVPTAFYLIAGIEPFTTTFVVAVASALVFGLLAPSPLRRAGRLIAISAAVLIVANAAFSTGALGAAVRDTSSPSTPEAMSRAALVVNGDNIDHRFLPLTADEAVWFNYVYPRKPMLRHYYDQGLLHADWHAWAFNAIYGSPFVEGRFASALDWYAIEALTAIGADPVVTTLSARAGLRVEPRTAAARYRQFAVERPSPIAVTTRAPVIVIVADARGYDQASRLVLDGGGGAGSRVPVWWAGTLDDLPEDLSRAAAVLVIGDRLGDEFSGGRRAEQLARSGTRVVWDIFGVTMAQLADPWPAAEIRGRLVDSWDVRDRAGRITSADFAPALFAGGAWGAQYPASPRPGAIIELSLAGEPFIVSSRVGTGSLTLLGGNLIYHALANTSAAERAYILALIADAPAGAATGAVWRMPSPTRRQIETDGAPVVLKESISPKWRASWRSESGEARDVPVRHAGPALMLVMPPGRGTITFDYGPSIFGWASWALFAAGVASAVWLWRRRDVLDRPPS